MHQFLELDAFDYALATILSTKVGDGIHLITFYSQIFSTAKMNYNMHDKELLAIYEAFHKWKYYLEGTSILVEVLIDHKNLTYFQESKSLSRCQARWLEFLSYFNMIIKFWLGCLETKPDALTHRWDLYSKNNNNNFLEANPQNYHPYSQQNNFLHLQERHTWAPSHPRWPRPSITKCYTRALE